MGRGKHLSTKKKEMRALMKAMMVGLSTGEIAAAKKKYKIKNIPYIMLKKFDELKSDDVFKFVSIIGVAWTIKAGVDWTQGIIATALERAYTMPFPFGFGLGWGGEPPVMTVGQDTEMLEWILAFAAAYLIVENFGEIVAGAGSILSVANTLIGGMLAV